MSSKKNIRFWLIILMLLFTTAGTSFARQIFVDTNAPGNKDGSSWDNAYNFLQDALADASSGDEIIAAGGIYKPDQGTNITPGNRRATFQLINAVVIKGGYAGYGKPVPDERNINIYITILSGDLNGDDEPNFVNYADNSYNVTTGMGTNEMAILDGFMIIGGNANSNGGGMHNYRGSPTLRNCTFKANLALLGGGMYNDQSNPTLIGCTFIGNKAGDSGGGIYNLTSNPILTNCSFSTNTALNGGGIYCKYDSNPKLTNCTFNENSARYSGAMANYNSAPILKDCTFKGNSANYGGGILNYNSNPTLTSCNFVSNSASSDGGGINNNSSNPTLTSCFFIRNTAGSSGGGIQNYKSSSRIVGCTLIKNSAGSQGGGISNHENSNPTVTNSIIWQNSDSGSDTVHAQIYNLDSTPVVNYCCIQGWTDTLGGTGNINKEPQFADPNNDNYHLPPISPCVNAGDPNYEVADGETDIDGDPRVISDRVDIGADEYNNERLIPKVYSTVQAAIDAAYNGDVIVIYPGAYSGIGNRDIDFRGKVITVKSINPERYDVVIATIINGEAEGRVFYFHSGEDANSVINGLAIINGKETNGGGIYCKDSSPKIVNCIIGSNSAEHNGGGIYNDNSNPTLTNCTFEKNMAYYGGGGIHNYNSRPIMTNCTFKENWAKYGGGMHNRDDSSPTLKYCMFNKNMATDHGGGMDNYDCNPMLTNCIFSHNSVNGNGAGIYNKGGNLTLTNCSFIENESNDNGAGLFNLYARAILSDCKFRNNSCKYHGAGMFNGRSNPILTNCTFKANIADGNGGGLYNRQGSTTLTNCLFSGNSSNGEGGAIFNNNSPKLTNCTFAGNLADIGGGMYNDNASYKCSPNLINCILWGNKDNRSEIRYAQIYGDTPVVTYSCVQDSDPNDPNAYPGNGNINKDPRFVKMGCWANLDDPNISAKPSDKNAIWVEADHHLLPDSPCLDAGDPKSDFSNEPQPNGGRINMGAYGNTQEAISKSK